MNISRKGLEFIKGHEGLVLKAYADAGYGWDRATIGYGHTSQAGPPKVHKGMTITRKEASAILRQDLKTFESAIRRHVKVTLTQGMYDALCSFVFNVGIPNFRNSTLLRKLNQGDYIGAANEFAKWRKSNGRVLKGLVKRRAGEKALFLSDYKADEEEYVDVPELDTGKPVGKSTSVWTQIGTAATGIITSVLSLGETQPILTGFIILLLVAGAIYVIRERKRHGEEGLV